jgi:glycine amidinotransferase/scyllo-inosamine-4-phosphate amidinotransferase 1
MSDFLGCYSEFQPLKEVIVGRAYPPDYVDHFTDPDLREMLKKILYETEEDILKLIKFLEEQGARVRRPRLLFDLKFNLGPENKKRPRVDLHQFSFSFPNQPLMPRDTGGVYGSKVLEFYTKNCGRYFDNWSTYEIFHEYFLKGADWVSMPPPLLKMGETTYEDYNTSTLLFHAANILKCGKDLFYSQTQPNHASGKGTLGGIEWVKRNLETEFQLHPVDVGGHLDGKMAILKPGVVACWNKRVIPEKMRNWRIIEVPHTFGKLPESLRTARKKRFFKDFVERWLKEWIGYCDETVFDVNMFSVNEELVITNGYNKEVYRQLKENNIEGWPFHFRHQHFWDGAIHCLTLDTLREGGQEDYFS